MAINILAMRIVAIFEICKLGIMEHFVTRNNPAL